MDAVASAATATTLPVEKEDSKAGVVSGKVEPFQIEDDEHNEEGEFLNDEGGDKKSPESSPPEIDVQWTKGTVQAPAYRDGWFALAFVAQFLTVLGVAIAFGAEAVILLKGGADSGSRRLGAAYGLGRALKKKATEPSYDDDAEQFESLYDDDTTDNEGESYERAFGTSSASGESSSDGSDQPPPEAFFPFVVVASIIAAPVLSVLALGYMSRNAALLIRASLYVAIGLNVLFFFITLLAGVPGSAFIHALFAALLACYAKAIWHRIPYAASNLRSAIVAVKANMGVALVAFTSVPASIAWIFTWTFAFAGTLSQPFMYTETQVSNSSGSDWSGSESGTHTETTMSGLGIFVIFMYILSFHWTLQVISGVVRTTIAGVIGTWWFSPLEASSFCSSAVRDSFSRSLTYSFGSICFGSLIVAIVETLRAWLRSASRQRNGIVRLIAQCLLLYIERLIEYFNKWAFVYVGLYGYSYLEAGKSVMTLFRERGWTAIISDNLVNRTLYLACFAIGLLVAIIAVIAGLLTEVLGGWLGWLAVAAWIGFLIGFILSCIMMGVLSGSVDAIIVCYAEAPMEFKENHPELHAEMEETWTAAWPDLTVTPVAVAVPLGGPNARDAPLN